MRTDGPDHDAGDLPEWAVGLRVPDDARDLDADLHRWRQEQRRQRVRTLRRRRPIAFAAGVCVLSLMGATGAGLVATMLPAAPDVIRHAAPLAPASTVAPGHVGGLLPDVTLRVDGRATPSRALRPVVLALVPTRCDCQRLVDNVSAQAAEFGVALVLVTTGKAAEVTTLAAKVRRGRVLTAYDAQGTLFAAFAPEGLTAVVVGDDGLVAAVQRDLSLPLRLEPALTRAYLARATSV